MCFRMRLPRLALAVFLVGSMAGTPVVALPQAEPPTEDASIAAFAALKKDVEALRKDTAKKQFRHHYEKLIVKLQAVATTHKQGQKADDAAFVAAQLLEELASVSRLATDLSAAIEAFVACADAFPKSNLADDALVAAARMEGASANARTLLRRVVAMPGADLKDEAKRQLAAQPVAPTSSRTSSALSPEAKAALDRLDMPMVSSAPLAVPAANVAVANAAFANGQRANAAAANAAGANETSASAHMAHAQAAKGAVVNATRASALGARATDASAHGASVSGASVAGASEPNLNAAGANGHAANAHGAHATGTNAHAANAHGAHATGANAHAATAHGAHATGANAHAANAHGAHATGANAHPANAHGAHATGANGHAANAHGAHATDASAHGASVAGASVSGASVAGASEPNLNAAGANGHAANAHGASVAGANPRVASAAVATSGGGIAGRTARVLSHVEVLPEAPPAGTATRKVVVIRHEKTPSESIVTLRLSGAVGVTRGEVPVREGGARRIFFDLAPARLGQRNLQPIEVHDGVVVRVRAGQYDDEVVRLVVELEGDAEPALQVAKKPFEIRLVTFLTPPGVDVVAGAQSASDVGLVEAPKPDAASVKERFAQSSAAGVSISQQLGLKVHRVVIDAGHGGGDTGAIGPSGIREKDVTLQIAKRVREKLLAEFPDVEVIMTRDDDRTLALQDRTNTANSASADLFISVHCNASPHRRVRGVETYTLNITHDRYAMKLAARENAEAGEGSISDLEFILADLAMKSNVDDSVRLGRSVQKNIMKSLKKRWSDVPDLGLKHALFYVLMGNHMPSILVETSFLSNKAEEQRLTTATYQDSIADGILDGVREFIQERQAFFAP